MLHTCTLDCRKAYILCYVKSSKWRGIPYSCNLSEGSKGFGNADYSNDSDSRKFATGFLFTLEAFLCSGKVVGNKPLHCLQQRQRLDICQFQTNCATLSGAENSWLISPSQSHDLMLCIYSMPIGALVFFQKTSLTRNGPWYQVSSYSSHFFLVM